jgi:hypothetical protein
MTINPIPKAIIDSSGSNISKGLTEWHEQEMKILKDWAEIAGSYRWMHNITYGIYKKKNLSYMIPIIIISTVTGTASFSLSAFPEGIRAYVPFIIGLFNLIAGLLTTIYNFLKISECMESHRIASINYGKLCRSVTVILSVPLKDRETSGADTVKTTRSEIDRLIEQSPSIPSKVINEYKTIIDPEKNHLAEPDIIKVSNVEVYVDIDAQVAAKVAEAASIFKKLQKPKPPPPPKPPVFESNATHSPTKRKQEEIHNELNQISNSKIVSNIDRSVIAGAMTIGKLKSRLGLQKERVPSVVKLPKEPEIQELVEPEPDELIEVVVETPEDPEGVHEVIEEPESPEGDNEVIEPEPEPDPEDPEGGIVIDEVVDEMVASVVAESVPPITAQRQTIESELEQLRQSGIVKKGELK